jgi:DNA mismatch repair ATPase MutS
MLKSILINVLLVQQCGCAYAESVTVYTLYDYLHCHINVPDTLGRFSLFQQEVARCKYVLDQIHQHPPHKQHLCLFDELFVSTGQSDAECAAFALLRHLAMRPNVTFVVTTHFTQMCDRFEQSRAVLPNIHNMHMESVETNNDHTNNKPTLTHTYQLKPGVCHIRGGLYVLQQFDFPSDIQDEMKSTYTCLQTKDTKDILDTKDTKDIVKDTKDIKLRKKISKQK